MKIFTVLNEDGYELAQPVFQDDFEKLNIEIHGRPHLDVDAWSPVKMKLLVKDDNGKRRLPSDAPWLGSHVLVLKESAVIAMHSILNKDAELLDVDCQSAKLQLVNPIHLIDALDEKQSVVKRFPHGDKRIWQIKKYSLIPDSIRGVDLFKMPNLRVSPIFFSCKFVKNWSDCGLRGLSFQMIWSDEQA